MEIRARVTGYLDKVLFQDGQSVKKDQPLFLIDPLTMPPVLLRAHQALDRAVDVVYRRAPFTTERERVAFLFERYQGLVAPLVQQGRRWKRKKK